MANCKYCGAAIHWKETEQGWRTFDDVHCLQEHRESCTRKAGSYPTKVGGTRKKSSPTTGGSDELLAAIQELTRSTREYMEEIKALVSVLTAKDTDLFDGGGKPT